MADEAINGSAVAEDPMAALESAASASKSGMSSAFVKASDQSAQIRGNQQQEVAGTGGNADEIAIDDDDDEEEE